MKYFAILLLLLAGSALAAEEAPPPDRAHRPRIGLVLSGGGARGVAHVGVLKVLEQMHVPIDAIVGTSMGAVVGGLYASGMSADDIERLLKSVDWQDALSDRLPRKDLGFRRKQDDRNFLVRYALGVNRDGFKLPKGIIQGQKLSQTLRSATMPVAEIQDFDRLPVPFRAVATDLESGAAVIMSSGDLVTAMRASMSVPGVFIPTEREGRLLVDGGLVQNLSIDVARQMHVDVLIAVDVSFPLYPRNELTSPLEILQQASAIMMRSRTIEQREKLTAGDILIDVSLALGTFGSTDFAHVNRARDVGEQVARAAGERLASLSLDDSGYRRYLAARNPRILDAPRIAFVRTDAVSQRYQTRVAEILREQIDKPLDKQNVERRLEDIYALDLFESVDYSIVEDAGQTGLEFHLRRKSWGPNYIRVGLNLTDDFRGNSRYNAAARVILTELNELGGEWLNDIQVGDHPLFYSEFYQPLAFDYRYFFAPHLNFEARNLEVRDANQRISVYRVRQAEGGVDVGRELSNWGEWRVGILRGQGSSYVRIGDPTLPEQRLSSGGYFARFSYDKLDNLFFARDGAQFQMQWTGQRENVGADRHSDRVAVSGLVARSFDRNTFVISADVGATLNSQTYPQDYFSLGGFLNLSGLHTGELTGPQYGIGRLIYYRQIGHGGTGVFDVPLYAGLSLEAGNVWLKRSDIDVGDLRKNFSVFLGADTILGPVYLGAGADRSGQSALYLFLGKTF